MKARLKKKRKGRVDLFESDDEDDKKPAAKETGTGKKLPPKKKSPKKQKKKVIEKDWDHSDYEDYDTFVKQHQDSRKQAKPMKITNVAPKLIAEELPDQFGDKGGEEQEELPEPYSNRKRKVRADFIIEQENEEKSKKKNPPGAKPQSTGGEKWVPPEDEEKFKRHEQFQKLVTPPNPKPTVIDWWQTFNDKKTDESKMIEKEVGETKTHILRPDEMVEKYNYLQIGVSKMSKQLIKAGMKVNYEKFDAWRKKNNKTIPMIDIQSLCDFTCAQDPHRTISVSVTENYEDSVLVEIDSYESSMKDDKIRLGRPIKSKQWVDRNWVKYNVYSEVYEAIEKRESNPYVAYLGKSEPKMVVDDSWFEPLENNGSWKKAMRDSRLNYKVKKDKFDPPKKYNRSYTWYKDVEYPQYEDEIIGLLYEPYILSKDVLLGEEHGRWIGLAKGNKKVFLNWQWVNDNFAGDYIREAVNKCIERANKKLKSRFVKIVPGDPTPSKIIPIQLKADDFIQYYQGQESYCLIYSFCNALHYYGCYRKKPFFVEAAKKISTDKDLLEAVNSPKLLDQFNKTVNKHLLHQFQFISVKGFDPTKKNNQDFPVTMIIKAKDGGIRHAVALFDGKVYDSSYEYAMINDPLTFEHICEPSGFDKPFKVWYLVQKYNKPMH